LLDLIPFFVFVFVEIATGNQPSPRAAHASVAVELNQVVVYGGATGGNY